MALVGNRDVVKDCRKRQNEKGRDEDCASDFSDSFIALGAGELFLSNRVVDVKIGGHLYSPNVNQSSTILTYLINFVKYISKSVEMN